MKKKSLLFATAIIALASCADSTFIGDQETLQSGDGAISFDLRKPGATRADKTGAAAATDLNEQFYVYAIKSESTDGAGSVADGNLVFNNYVVKWTTNSAYTTTSNTKNWEYVGYTLSAKEIANIGANSGAVAQTIKYWDWGAPDYTFYAFSAKPTDISGDLVKVTKVQDEDSPSTVYDNGYTLILGTDASLDDLYFSERSYIEKSGNTDRQATNSYGGNVTFRFHNLATKVRVAMYETIPGYSVTINSFKVVDNASPTFPTMTTTKTANFAANFVNNASGRRGNMTVKYVASGTTQNYPTVTFTPRNAENTADEDPANILELGDELKAGVTIGETITGATFDRADGADADSDPDYTSVFPKEDNTQNLKLKVCYTLTAPITGETIIVKDATAEIPAAYLQWKPGYAYTYIFKISDNTDGHSGSSSEPAGLYPITFDAIEMVDADGLAEYITTVSEPSITTFGVKDSKYVTGGNDYEAGTIVYATVMDGSSLATLEASNMKLYTVTGTGDLTEAGVAEALIEKPTMTKAQVDLAKVIPAASAFTGYTKTVPGEDGVDKDLDASDAKAAYFTTATGIKYALVYQKTAATYVCAQAETVTTTDADDFDTKEAAAPGGKLYTSDECTTEATRGAGTFYKANGKTYTSAGFDDAGQLYTNAACTTKADSWSDGVTYYKPIKVKDKGVYTVKVVTCP